MNPNPPVSLPEVAGFAQAAPLHPVQVVGVRGLRLNNSLGVPAGPRMGAKDGWGPKMDGGLALFVSARYLSRGALGLDREE